MDKYCKVMEGVDESFTYLKESTNILDIAEIASNFVKSEEQNKSLYNYLNFIVTDIENTSEKNREIKLENEELMVQLM